MNVTKISNLNQKINAKTEIKKLLTRVNLEEAKELAPFKSAKEYASNNSKLKNNGFLDFKNQQIAGIQKQFANIKNSIQKEFNKIRDAKVTK